jgi:hypothetical protein
MVLAGMAVVYNASLIFPHRLTEKPYSKLIKPSFFALIHV